MNKQTEALNMAIEAMEATMSTHGFKENIYDAKEKAIQACKEALEQPAELDLPQQRWSKEKEMIESWKQPAQEPVAFNCKNCHACLKGVADERGLPVTLTRMIVCPDCGNKRCPKASDHRHFCTNSNDTDQAGSIYRTHPAPSWQGLSDDEIHNYADHNFAFASENFDEIFKFARAIEQALKEKNN